MAQVAPRGSYTTSLDSKPFREGALAHPTPPDQTDRSSLEWVKLRPKARVPIVRGQRQQLMITNREIELREKARPARVVDSEQSVNMRQRLSARR